MIKPINTSLTSSLVGSMTVSSIAAGVGQGIVSVSHAGCPVLPGDSYRGVGTDASSRAAPDGCAWRPAISSMHERGASHGHEGIEWVLPSIRSWWMPLWQRALEEKFEPHLMASMLQTVQEEQSQFADELLQELLKRDSEKGARVRELFQGPEIGYAFVSTGSLHDDLERILASASNRDLGETNRALAELYDAIWGIRHPETFIASYALLMECVASLSTFQPESSRGAAAFALSEARSDIEPARRPGKFDSLHPQIVAALESVEHSALQISEVGAGMKTLSYLSFAAKALGRMDKAETYALRKQELLKNGTILPSTLSEMARDEAVIMRLEDGSFDFIMRPELTQSARTKLMRALGCLREGAYREALEVSRKLPIEERVIIVAALAHEVVSMKHTPRLKSRISSWFAGLMERFSRFRNDRDA